MQLELKIPKKENKKEIEKTYTSDLVDIPFGIIMNLSKALDFDDLKDVDNTQLGLALVKNIKEIETLFLYIFDGLTEEELNRVGSLKLVPIVFQIIKETKDQLVKEVKNVMGGH